MQRILFVFRKPNKGNFSIEKVYQNIFEKLKLQENKSFVFSKIVLKKNYDLFSFFKYFFTSFFKKKYIVHITGGCNYMALSFPFKLKILTIHDIFHFKKMKGIKGILYDIFYFYLPIRFCDKIIVVSESTKQVLLNNFSIDENKIKVINNPLVIPSHLIEEQKLKFLSKEVPIKILQIGDKPLKNFERLLEATKNLNVRYNFVHTNTSIINNLIQKYRVEKKANIHCGLSDHELYDQYKSNDVLFFASETEGFGLPIIEAQAFGLPIITSNIPPMNKVGEGAIFVNPFCVDSIREGFSKLYDRQILKENALKSRSNVKKYKISTVVEKYKNYYKSIA